MKYIKKPSNQFIRDYKLPMVISVVFILVVSLLLINRTINKIALAEVFSKTNSNDYNNLLSNNSDNTKTSSNTTADQQEADKPANTPFSIAPSPTTPPTIQDPLPSPNNPPNQPAPPPTPPPMPFGVSVQSLSFVGSELIYCSSGPGGANTPCYRKYFYKSKLQTYNGPGTVKYRWEGTFDEINSNGSYSAGSGDQITTLNKDFQIPCSVPQQTFYIRFLTTEPNESSSAPLSQYHDCSTTR